MLPRRNHKISHLADFCSLRIAEVGAVGELDTGLESTVTFSSCCAVRVQELTTASKLLEFAWISLSQNLAATQNLTDLLGTVDH